MACGCMLCGEATDVRVALKTRSMDQLPFVTSPQQGRELVPEWKSAATSLLGRRAFLMEGQRADFRSSTRF